MWIVYSTHANSKLANIAQECIDKVKYSGQLAKSISEVSIVDKMYLYV